MQLRVAWVYNFGAMRLYLLTVRYTEKNWYSISFQIEWDMIVVTVFLSILKIEYSYLIPLFFFGQYGHFTKKYLCAEWFGKLKIQSHKKVMVSFWRHVTLLFVSAVYSQVISLSFCACNVIWLSTITEKLSQVQWSIFTSREMVPTLSCLVKATRLLHHLIQYAITYFFYFHIQKNFNSIWNWKYMLKLKQLKIIVYSV